MQAVGPVNYEVSPEQVKAIKSLKPMEKQNSEPVATESEPDRFINNKTIEKVALGAAAVGLLALAIRKGKVGEAKQAIINAGSQMKEVVKHPGQAASGIKNKATDGLHTVKDRALHPKEALSTVKNALTGTLRKAGNLIKKAGNSVLEVAKHPVNTAKKVIAAVSEKLFGKKAVTGQDVRKFVHSNYSDSGKVVKESAHLGQNVRLAVRK